jgi:hypothetical protein
MKFLLSFLACFLLLVTPMGAAEGEKPYLAVFCNPGMSHEWFKFHPDNLVVAFNWDGFDCFLKRTKEEAGERPIEIDIDCHGSDRAVIQYKTVQGLVTYEASMGFICNHIENIVGPNCIVLCEFCYPGYVYKSLRGMLSFSPGAKTEAYHGLVPPFPILINTPNRNSFINSVFLQYRTHTNIGIRDARRLTYLDPPVVHKNPRKLDDYDLSVWRVTCILYKIYNP